MTTPIKTAHPVVMDAHDAFDYWRTTAFSNPSAQALASQLNLTLFNPSIPSYACNFYGFKGGLMYPVRRLVITGKDTIENMVILFGPNWESDIKEIWTLCRRELFAPPRPGLLAHRRAESLDEGTPGWTPRPPSVEEEREVREMGEVEKLAGEMSLYG